MFHNKTQTHQAFCRYKQKAYHSGEDNSHRWHLQCVSATGFSCPFLQVCLFLLLGPCKPSDLLAERGLCPAGGGGEDVTDAGASEPASCSVNFPRLICIHKEPTPLSRSVFFFSLPPKNPVRLLVGVRRENLTVKDDKTNESLCQTSVASTMTDGGELSLRRSAGFILE